MAFLMRLGAMARRATSFARHATDVSPWEVHHRTAESSTFTCPQLIGKIPYTTIHGPIGPDGLPVSVDWRDHGAVTKVSSQGDCGCCWAFGATAAVESLNVIKGNQLVKLSEQQLLDCVDLNCEGCRGGWPEAAFSYIIDNGGQVPFATYPYVGFQHWPNIVVAEGVTISDYECYSNISDHLLKKLVACQPVVAAVGADEDFSEYDNGVVVGPDYTEREMHRLKIAHIVTIVGYGVADGKHWLVKNSWGEDWGLGGYILIARSTGMLGGAFGINRFISYPLKQDCPNRSCVTVRSESRRRMLDWM